MPRLMFHAKFSLLLPVIEAQSCKLRAVSVIRIRIQSVAIEMPDQRIILVISGYLIILEIYMQQLQLYDRGFTDTKNRKTL